MKEIIFKSITVKKYIMENSFFSRTEVAHVLGVHPLTVRNWEKQGKLKAAFYVGLRPRYSIEDLEKIYTEKPDLLNKKTATNG